MAIWNPWHGCHKISAGCRNCYVYRRDESIGKDASVVSKTKDFNLPIRRDKQLVYELLPDGGVVYACMTSDFFLEDADLWRDECWKMIKKRKDLTFVIITKRIHRFLNCIPEDWGEGYPNVVIGCTCENQEMADFRLPIFIGLPIQHRNIIHEPLLGPINASAFLSSGKIEKVICGGESGSGARMCDYQWILDIRRRCIDSNVEFVFKQTGAFFRKEGREYRIERSMQQSQARKAEIDYKPNTERCETDSWLRRDLFERISESRFRSRFHLKDSDRKYISQKGINTIREHAEAFLRERIGAARILNDGKQTPMRGHPVFLAQHACGCCCRGCLEKWHGIPQGRPLSETEIMQLTDVLMEWISNEMRTENDNQISGNFLDATDSCL